MFTQGTKVKRIDDGHVLGYIAGQFDAVGRPNLYTIIIPKEYKDNVYAPWLWETRQGPEHPLDSICRGNYVYNMWAHKIQACTTKLGNEL